MDKRPRFWFDVRRAQGPSAEFDNAYLYTSILRYSGRFARASAKLHQKFKIAR
jgi:hypothetical protein